MAPGPRNPREREYPGGCRGVTGPVPLPLLMKAKRRYVSVPSRVNRKSLYLFAPLKIHQRERLVDSSEAKLHLELSWGQANVLVKRLGEGALIAEPQILRHIPDLRPFALKRLTCRLDAQL